MTHKVLVINGNPKQQSLSQALAESYARGAKEAGQHVELVHLYELDFNPSLSDGYDGSKALEEDLLRLKTSVSEAKHIVVVFPVWWGSVPASLKGVLDKVLLPGFAYKYEKNDLLPTALLKGRSARIIMTMDTPLWYYRFVYQSPATKMMKKMVFAFCGFKPVRVTEFGGVIKSTQRRREKFIEQVYCLGKKGL